MYDILKKDIYRRVLKFDIHTEHVACCLQVHTFAELEVGKQKLGNINILKYLCPLFSDIFDKNRFGGTVTGLDILTILICNYFNKKGTLNGRKANTVKQCIVKL